MRRKLSELTPDPNNARRHSSANIKAIRDSLSRFGQVLPLVVSPDGTVIGGNGTLLAAEQLGWEDVEVSTFDGGEDAAKALAIALNRTAELAEWDKAQLDATLGDLFDAGYEPVELGFSDLDLDHLFPVKPEPLPKALERPPIDDAEPPRLPVKTSEPPPQYLLIFDDKDQEARVMDWFERLRVATESRSIAEAIDYYVSEQ